MKILFLDIDGVFIPQRAYDMPGQTRPLVTKFDPCAVGMVNTLCEKFGAQLVIHSSWLRSQFGLLQAGADSVKGHMMNEGLNAKYFHKDAEAKWRYSGSRWLAITDWLDAHPEVTHGWVLEDEPCPNDYELDSRLKMAYCDFQEGITHKLYWRLWCDLEKISCQNI